MAELLEHLQNEYSRSGGALPRSLATKLTLEQGLDPAGLELRQGYDFRRTVLFLKAADFWLDSANSHDEASEALAGAALMYTAFVDAAAQPTEAWWPVHAVAYSVLQAALKGGFGLRLCLDRDAQRRLYDVAIETAKRLGCDDPSESEATESLLLLVKEYVEFLEK